MNTPASIRITCPAFNNYEAIPSRYTGDGEDFNPPLHIEGIPMMAKSLVLVVDDPDAPRGTWVHWIVWNIPVVGNALDIDSDAIPGLEGVNDFGKHHYGGPCPPSGTHRYFFKIYALDCELSLPSTSRKPDLEKSILGHVLAHSELIGTYARN